MALAEIRDQVRADRSRGMSLSVRTDRETSVVSLGGNVDLENSPAARAVLLSCVDEQREVVVDLRGVYYPDSAGIASLIEALARAKHKGRRFSLISANELAVSRAFLEVLASAAPNARTNRPR